ncbi:MAG: hypothetical protein EZS26_002354 [Candidatus Ordinivivax streblomastigis]|uniref:F5/8 type C domain-containing protein n=1 Tax=Candidatus Ordinivivax streblomastigis TaxID=2540710 RepID=A0A5M8NZB0_9BACT|nr:MAG: hypothetical protein EZS26_002354 [Candidatus Ordinivivax streblomastigis]
MKLNTQANKRSFFVLRSPFSFLLLLLFLSCNKVSAQSNGIFENIAIGKPVTSNVDNLSFCEPAKALNGTVNTTTDKWSSSGDGEDVQWITVDLQGQFTLARYVVKHAGYGSESTFLNTADFEILKSNDGQTFTSVDQITGNTADVTDKDVTPFTARYVRLQISKAQRSSSRKCTVYAFELYEKPSSAINANSFYATEGFERFASTADLKQAYTVSGGDIALETIGKTKALKWSYTGQSMITVNLPNNIDLSDYTVWGMDFKFPTTATRAQVKSSQTLYATLVDADGKSATVNYPFDNSIWMMDERPWVSWHINMKDFASLNLKSVAEIHIGVNANEASGFLIDNLSFERQKYVLDFTKIIRTDKITEAASVIRQKANDGKGAFWGTSIIKTGRRYSLFQAWWSSGKDFDTGAIDYLTAPNLLGPYAFVNTALPRYFVTSAPSWGEYTHGPDIVKYGDTYYLYYSSGGSSDGSGHSREVGVAWSKTVEGGWEYSQGPILTKGEFAIIPGDEDYNGCWSSGVENPRMMEKDGEYYLFFKTLNNYNLPPEGSHGQNGNYGWFLGYSIAKSSTPIGPFTHVRNSGLRGRGRQYALYPSVAEVEAEGKPRDYSAPGHWDLEDMCIFKYIDGRYYGILKDFMGRWARRAELRDLVLFVSDNLLDWRVADFPLVITPVRTPRFNNQTPYKYSLMERPYVFWENDFKTGSISFAVEANVGWTSVIYPLVNEDSDITGIETPEVNVSGESVQVYPNPDKDHLYIVSKESIKKVELIDMTGKIVFSTGALSQTYLGLPNFIPSGQYVLKTTTDKRNIVQTKILINK